MKAFLNSLMGSLAALFIFASACLLTGILVLFVIAAGSSERSGPKIEKGAYVVLDLGTPISDAPPTFDLGGFRGRSETMQIRQVVRALRAAAKDERIAGVYLSGDLSLGSLGGGYASLREVRLALGAVRAAGKPVVAYLTQATTKNYYLASAATELAIDPYGMILMPGLASEPMFYAGAFEKYGVNVQVTRVGKYKSAVEPFTRREMSPENREEIQKLLNDLWRTLLADISVERKVSPSALQAVVDAEGLIRPEVAKARGLVDRVAYRDEIYDELKARTGRAGSKEPFKQVTLADYAKATKDIADGAQGGVSFSSSHHGRIAVVYAEGEIVDGEGDDGEIGGSKFSRALRKLRQDEEVKAVVLRVNSPGGSASASEVIQREVRLLRKIKPVIVSMGNYAASGGYWISTYGDRIFAEPTTITGSIGVFGLQFDVKRLANDFGVTFDSVKTGRFADALTISRPKTPEELAVFQRMVDWIYGEFVGKVAESRRLDRARVEEIAQGRVWSGEEGKAVGLVDEIGGLDAAIEYAARKAGLGRDYRLVEYPHQREFLEAIQELLDKGLPELARSRVGEEAGLVGEVTRRFKAELSVLKSMNDPQGVYARLPLNLSLR
jgi:protease-4